MQCHRKRNIPILKSEIVVVFHAPPFIQLNLVGYRKRNHRKRYISTEIIDCCGFSCPSVYTAKPSGDIWLDLDRSLFLGVIIANKISLTLYTPTETLLSRLILKGYFIKIAILTAKLYCLGWWLKYRNRWEIFAHDAGWLVAKAQHVKAFLT